DRAEATQPGEELRFAAAGAANRRMGDLRRWTAPGSAAEDRSRRRQHARDDRVQRVILPRDRDDACREWPDPSRTVLRTAVLARWPRSNSRISRPTGRN